MNFSNISTEDLIINNYQVLDEYAKLTADAEILLKKMQSVRQTVDAIKLEIEKRNGITDKEINTPTGE